MADKIRAGLIIMLWLVFCADWFMLFLLWVRSFYYDDDTEDRDNE